MSAELLKTPLHALHLELGARMVPFAGYDMPVNYPGGIIAEHKQCRESAALFDVSHMGQVRLVGDDAAKALETLVPVDVLGLAVGQQRYALFTDASGGILDDLMVTRREGDLLLVVNAGCKDADLRHLVTNIGHRCQVIAHARACAAGAAGPAGRGRAEPSEPRRRPPGVHDRRQLQAGRRRVLRHTLGLHRRRRLRDLGAGRRRGDAGARADQPARGQARRPGRARHAAPGSRAVPVRPRHRHPHQPGPGRPDLGHPEGAPPRRRARRPLPRRRCHRHAAGQRRQPQARRPGRRWNACRCAKAPSWSTRAATSSAP